MVSTHLYFLVGARDGRTQSACACLFVFPSSKPIPQKTYKFEA
jgi:hypothetical protein